MIITQYILLSIGLIALGIYIWLINHYRLVCEKERPKALSFDDDSYLDEELVEDFSKKQEQFLNRLTKLNQYKDIAFWLSLGFNCIGFVFGIIWLWITLN